MSRQGIDLCGFWWYMCYVLGDKKSNITNAHIILEQKGNKSINFEEVKD